MPNDVKSSDWRVPLRVDGYVATSILPTSPPLATNRQMARARWIDGLESKSKGPATMEEVE